MSPRTDLVARVVIQAFEASNDSSAVSVSRILPSLLRHHLAEAGGIQVRQTSLAGSSSQAYQAEGPTLTVDGVVREVSDGVTANVGVSDIAGVIATRSFRRTYASSDGTDDLAWDIAQWLRIVIGRELLARERFANAEDRRAIDLLEQAELARRKARNQRDQGLVDVAERGFAEADSLSALAEIADPNWVEPHVARARIAGELAWLALLTVPPDTKRLRTESERALEIATRAVALSPNDALAVETRGLLADRLQALTPVDKQRAATMLAAARSDLERAVALDRRRVRAWSALSLMAYLEGDFASALWMASTAYELDQYLENAPEILFRLFASAHELRDDDAAAAWCSELRRRYPDEVPALYCQLGLLAWKEAASRADADAAWSLLESAASRSFLPAIRPRFELMVASILAGAALPDSAEALASRATASGRSDAELLHFEAHVRMRLGQPDSARALLERFIAEKPSTRGHILQSRRFEHLTARLQ